MIMRSIMIISMMLLSMSLQARKEIDWNTVKLPPISSDRMWCLWTEYEEITDAIYMCTYTCENGMLLNIPGDGHCVKAVKEERW